MNDKKELDTEKLKALIKLLDGNKLVADHVEFLTYGDFVNVQMCGLDEMHIFELRLHIRDVAPEVEVLGGETHEELLRAYRHWLETDLRAALEKEADEREAGTSQKGVPGFNIGMTRTGRISGKRSPKVIIRDFALQPMPVRTDEGRELRAAFQKPHGDYVDLDFSSMEMRLLGIEAEQKTLSQLPPTLFDMEHDIHSENVRKMMGIDWGSDKDFTDVVVVGDPAQPATREALLLAEKNGLRTVVLSSFSGPPVLPSIGLLDERMKMLHDAETTLTHALSDANAKDFWDQAMLPDRLVPVYKTSAQKGREMATTTVNVPEGRRDEVKRLVGRMSFETRSALVAIKAIRQGMQNRKTARRLHAMSRPVIKELGPLGVSLEEAVLVV